MNERYKQCFAASQPRSLRLSGCETSLCLSRRANFGSGMAWIISLE